MRTEQEMFNILTKMAAEDERIRAAYLFGSRADPDAKKDIYQDYDVSFVVTETDSFQADKKWLDAFGGIAMFNEAERNGLIFFGRKDMSVLSRRCIFKFLFSDDTCMDLVLEIKEEAVRSFAEYQPAKILTDKDGILSGINLSSDKNYEHLKPDEDMYRACCSNFWWFFVYPAKSIARGKIPFAMVSFNSFTRVSLNRMIEWYIGIETDFSVPIGKREKNYEKFLPKDLYDLYSKTYTENDYWNIVFVSCELFSRLALAVGKHFNFDYNQQEEDVILEYLRKIKDNCLV